MPQTAEQPPLFPEAELLLCCARLQLTSGDAERLEALLRGGIDWDRFVPLAAEHRLLPLVQHHLGAFPPTLVPEEVADFLGEAVVENAGHVLRLTGELVRVLDWLEAHGVEAVPYKGPALAARLYGNVALRQAGDLDILVAEEQVNDARRLLEARGYRPLRRLSPAEEAFQLRGRKSEVFEQEGHTSVELHWAFTDGFCVAPMSFAELRARLERVRLGGTEVPVFARTDLALILSVHGFKHCWDRLEWICGVAELLRADALDHSSVAWADALARAETAGARRILLLGLALAHTLLDAPLPVEVQRALDTDPAVTRLIPEVRRFLFEHGPGSGDLLTRDMFRVRVLHRGRDRLRFLIFRLTTPDPSGWRLLRMGGRIVPLHAVVLPLRLLTKVGVRKVREHFPFAKPAEAS